MRKQVAERNYNFSTTKNEIDILVKQVAAIFLNGLKQY